MTKPSPRVPRLLLCCESLLGLSRASRARTLEIAARYQEPEALAVAFSKALGAGAEGVLAGPAPLLRSALAELKASVPVYALLPGVPDYLRDSAAGGLPGAIAHRLARADVATKLRLGFSGVSTSFGGKSADFTTLVPLLLELEMVGIGARDLAGVVLAAPLTDLALAGGHRVFFERYTRFVRRRFRAAAGLETGNLGHLLRALREWGVRPDFVIGPVNSRGLRMKPTPGDVVAELAHHHVPVLASELRASGAVPLVEGARYAREKGVHGLVPDLADLDDLGAELRGLVAEAPVAVSSEG